MKTGASFETTRMRDFVNAAIGMTIANKLDAFFAKTKRSWRT